MNRADKLAKQALAKGGVVSDTVKQDILLGFQFVGIIVVFAPEVRNFEPLSFVHHPVPSAPLFETRAGALVTVPPTVSFTLQCIQRTTVVQYIFLPILNQPGSHRKGKTLDSFLL